MMEIPQLFDVVGKSQATATPAWWGVGDGRGRRADEARNPASEG
jgi:hypothetical protein